MGRIFTYEQIDAGQIPTAEMFMTAKNTFFDAVEDQIDKGLVEGTFIFGSVAADNSGPRSDFDVLISLPEGRLRFLRATKHIVSTVVEATNNTIPFAPIALSRESLQNAEHGIDRLLGQHMKSEHRIVRGENDPADYMQFPEQSAFDIVSGYLYQKKRRLIDTYTSVEPLDVDKGGLQRMLELPVAVGRKVLQAWSEVNDSKPANTDLGHNKRVLHQEARKLFTAYDLDRVYDHLVSSNCLYDKVLKDATEGGINRAVYEGYLRDLHNELPLAIAWLENVQKELLPRIKQP